MKKRILTGIIMGLILLPVVIVPELITVFELLIILFSVLASFEVLNMFDKEKKLPLGVKILCVVLTLMLYSSIVNNFAICENTLVCRLLSCFRFQLDMFLTLTIIFLCVM